MDPTDIDIPGDEHLSRLTEADPAGAPPLADRLADELAAALDPGEAPAAPNEAGRT